MVTYGICKFLFSSFQTIPKFFRYRSGGQTMNLWIVKIIKNNIVLVILQFIDWSYIKRRSLKRRSVQTQESSNVGVSNVGVFKRRSGSNVGVFKRRSHHCLSKTSECLLKKIFQFFVKNFPNIL